MPAIVNVSGGPFAAGTTIVYKSQIVDGAGAGIPAANLATLTLTIVDTLTGAVVGGVEQTNILNTGRGTVDIHGNMVVTLLPADTALTGEPGASEVQRSLVFDWTTTGLVGIGTGRHQVNFMLLALAGS